MVVKRKRGVYLRAVPTTRFAWEARTRTVAPSLAHTTEQLFCSNNSARLYTPAWTFPRRENAVVGRASCKLVVNRVYGDYLCSVYSRLSLYAMQFALSLSFSLVAFFSLTIQYRGNNDDQRKDFTRAWNESSRRSVACVWSETPGLPAYR